MVGSIARALVILALLLCFFILTARLGSASHESTNALLFAPLAGSVSSGAAGEGAIAFNGGSEPQSRWTVSFAFTGLQADEVYVVVDQGRFGEDGSPEATAFTPLCQFRADDAGAGGCWNYLIGLRRANVVQLRVSGEDGPPTLQATREPDGPGSITSVPNRFSPAPATTPRSLPTASPATG